MVCPCPDCRLRKKHRAEEEREDIRWNSSHPLDHWDRKKEELRRRREARARRGAEEGWSDVDCPPTPVEERLAIFSGVSQRVSLAMLMLKSGSTEQDIIPLLVTMMRDNDGLMIPVESMFAGAKAEIELAEFRLGRGPFLDDDGR